MFVVNMAHTKITGIQKGSGRGTVAQAGVEGGRGKARRRVEGAILLEAGSRTHNGSPDLPIKVGFVMRAGKFLSNLRATASFLLACVRASSAAANFRSASCRRSSKDLQHAELAHEEQCQTLAV
jgi:hypothetical protein